MSANLILLIQNNEVVGYSTDTVYGLVAKLDKNNIQKINSLKQRPTDQPLQILISSIEDIKDVIEHNEFIDDYLKNNLKEKTSYIVKANEEFNSKYLTDSFNKTIMFRIPTGSIREVLEHEKILFATSANIHGEIPVTTKEEFKKAFPSLEVGGEDEHGKASTIISLLDNKEKIIRN